MTLATRCGAALSVHPVPVEAAGECAGEILERLDGERPDLLVCLASESHAGAFDDVAGALRKLIEPDVLIGGVFQGVAGGEQQVEGGPALSVLAVDLGGGRAAPVRLEAHPDDGGTTITGWPEGVAPRGTLVMLADAATFPVEDFLGLANHNLPGLTVLGGLSSAIRIPGGGIFVLDDEVLSSGALGVLLDPDVPVRSIVSQGCRPIGQPFTVTRAERNRVLELAGRPAVERLREVAVAVAIAGDDQDLMRRGLHMGIVVDEHKVDFRRGDFLVRTLQGVDEETGAISIRAPVEVGQTVQFQVRDAESADEDLDLLLGTVDTPPAGVLLFTSGLRGPRFFASPGHDAAAVQDAFGPVPLAGALCGGEIGPVGGRSHSNAVTATALLLV